MIRMLKIIVLFMTLAFSVSSFADSYPASKKWYVSAASNGLHDDSGTACRVRGEQLYNAGATRLYSWSVGNLTSTSANCYWIYQQLSNNATTPANAGMGIQYTCPAGATLNGTTCTDACISPQKLINGSCQLDNCSALKGAMQEYTLAANTLDDVCMDGCTLSPDVGVCGQFSSTHQCQYVAYYTGQTCSQPNPTPVLDTPEFNCIKQGKTYGTVNGNVVCLTAGTTGTPPVTTTSGNTKTTSTKDAAGNTTGTSTTTTTTTCTNNSCNTTITNPDGTKTENQQDKQSFCEENPNTKICQQQEESNFGGACGAFQCDGDAVQCAIAKKQHQDRCDDLVEDSTSQLGGNIIDGITSTNNPLATENATEVNVATTVNGAALLPKTGLSNVSMPLGGHTVVLPFSKLNAGLELVGKFVLAISYLISAMIIFGRKV